MRLGALILSGLFAAGPARWMDLSEPDRVSALKALPDGPLTARLLAVSERFLETPYGVSPLGEGEGHDPDPDPMIRYDLVDCLTYVEETMAMSLSAPDEVLGTLTQLRYAHVPEYADRNHLMEAEWLPHNIAKGFLRDITSVQAGSDTAPTAKVLTKGTWESPSSRALGLPVERQVVGRFGLTMIPLEKVMDHAREIPSGTLMVVIREDRPGKVTRITHLGFVVQKHKRTYLRHAARNTFMRVIDEDLESFLLRNSKYEKWKVDGVSLYQVQKP